MPPVANESLPNSFHVIGSINENQGLEAINRHESGDIERQQETPENAQGRTTNNA
jgi:hypothetical protein